MGVILERWRAKQAEIERWKERKGGDNKGRREREA